MEVSLNSEIAFCKHCNSIIPNERRDEFCCNGCETVFQILAKAGLGEYYQLKENSVCFQKAKPAQLYGTKFGFETHSANVKFYLEGVHCSACLWLLEKLPLVIPEAVLNCSLNLSTSVLSVTLKHPSQVNEVASKINDWGYFPHLIRAGERIEDRIQNENKIKLLELGIAGAITGNVMLLSIPLYSGVAGSMERLFENLSFLLAIPALFYSGRVFFKNVYSGFKMRVFPIDAPILLALLTAFFYSTFSLIQQTHQLYFDSLTALIFLLLSSRYYLARLRQSSQMNMGVLNFFQSNYTGKIGDIERLKPNEKICFDGVVRKGEGWCDLSQFTGESEPVKVQVGDMVYAGTLFLESSSEILIEVQRIGTETRLAQLLEKVSTAQSQRTKTELTSDRWSQGLLVIVMNLAFISFGYFVFNGNIQEGIKRVLALLIVTCPCALALATPLVFTLAMKSLLKKGVLVKDPASLDRLPEVKKIFFDKTGTITEGHLQAEVEIKNLSVEDQSALYSLVRMSRHPASRAIERAFIEQKIPARLMILDHFQEKLGTGLFGTYSLSEYSLCRGTESKSEFAESVFRKQGVELCRIILKDRTRPESKSIVKALKNKGMSVYILSGDHELSVRRLANELEVNHYYSLRSPEVKSWAVGGEMMVGDGINDALALAKAEVSLAVQGGMEAAIQSAQVYSLKPGISTVLPMIETAHRVRNTLKQNFILSTSYNLVGAVLSLTGHMNPLIAAILMPASALTVFWSSMIRMKESE